MPRYRFFVQPILKLLALNEDTFQTKPTTQKLGLNQEVEITGSMPHISGLTGQVYKSPFDPLVDGALPTMAVKQKRQDLSSISLTI